MQCPVDGEVLAMTHRNGVEIDYCPRCRGVWLDRGELDKIVEQSAASAQSERPAAPVELREPRSARPAEQPRYRDDDDDDDDDDYRRRGRRPKRRESFLSELFDF